MDMSKVNELEKIATKINLKLRLNNSALILKIPVPIIYTSKGLIAQPSTVDYTGIVQGGQFIAYDAKECMSKTSFPLSNIHQHQLEYLEMVRDLGGLAFFLIHMKTIYPDKGYIVPTSLVHKYWYGNERRSIPVSDLSDAWLTPLTEEYIIKIQEMKDVLLDRD